MKIFAPKYYKQFHCIASKCSHSCCVGWEIDVDEKSLNKYHSANSNYAKEICKSIDDLDTPHFKLQPNGKCSHLDENGLCKIITNLGEDYLCDICREHPRFYNQTPYGLEVGLGLSCEEACRIILSSFDYAVFEEVDEDNSPLQNLDFNAIPLRNEILSTLLKRDLSYEQKIQSLTKRFLVNLDFLTDSEWVDVINSLEYLNNNHKDVFSCFSSKTAAKKSIEVFLERIFAYFVYRYVTKSQSEEELHQYLGLCLFLEQLLRSILVSKNITLLKDIIPFAITLSEEIEYSENNIEDILFQFI